MRDGPSTRYRAIFEGWKLNGFAAPKGPFTVDVFRVVTGKWFVELVAGRRLIDQRGWASASEAQGVAEAKFERCVQGWVAVE